MRRLSENFIKTLQSGFLSGITKAVIRDRDLVLDIRENYINIYFKGNSILKLREVNPERYQASIHKKILGDLPNPVFQDEKSTGMFIKSIPDLKENIIRLEKSSLEIEYEQMLIRANNHELRNNSEYFIIDRQYAIDKERFDLIGFYWSHKGRKRSQEVPLCFFEIKFALNPDIADVACQINRYYDVIQTNMERMAVEADSLLHQKLELGLFGLDPNRLDVMKTLTISRDIKRYQFILILVDYNPYSQLFDPQKLALLPFANQIKIFCGGFALWRRNVKTISEILMSRPTPPGEGLPSP